MESYGLSGQDLVKHFNRELSRLPEEEVPGSMLFEALALLSDVDYRLASGCNPLVQFDAFLAKLIVISQN